MTSLRQDAQVSVVIPTHDKAERLVLALHALLRQSIGLARFEVIVVADGCTDRTATVVDDVGRLGLRVRLLETHQAGQAVARNRGVGEAQGGVLLFLDDDVLLCPGYIERAMTALVDRREAVVRAPVRSLRYLAPFRDPERGIPFDEHASPLAAETFRTHLISRRQITEEWPRLAAQGRHLNRFETMVSRILREGPADLRWVGYSGSGVALPRTRFEQAGGYDESFGLRWGAESLELGYRLWTRGTDFIELAEALSLHMEHPRRASLASFRESFDLFFERHRDPRIRRVQAMISGAEFPASRPAPDRCA